MLLKNIGKHMISIQSTVNTMTLIKKLNSSVKEKKKPKFMVKI